MARPSRLVAGLAGTLFGSGRSPFMPGTCGSIVAAAMIAPLPDPWYAPVTAALAIVACTLGPAVARVFMAESGRSDPQHFVLDEGAGVWIAAFRPSHPGLLVVAICVVCFRVFDIWKPGPIRRVEALPRGYGVVYDDVIAGVFALAVSILIELALAR